MPLIDKKVELEPGAAERIADKTGYSARHIRYAAKRQRPAKPDLLALIKAHKKKAA